MPTLNPLTQDESRLLFTYPMQRPTTDMAFRRALLHDPKEALEQEFDFVLPPQFNIRFVENHGADLTIVLPDPPGHNGLLSDRELEYVAGGNAEPVLDFFSRHFPRPPRLR